VLFILVTVPLLVFGLGTGMVRNIGPQVQKSSCERIASEDGVRGPLLMDFLMGKKKGGKGEG
jgi:hypothetical protein